MWYFIGETRLGFEQREVYMPNITTNQLRKIRANQKTWDKVCDQFADASALPTWGPFGVGKNLKLIPEIKGRAFLEICCGSGRSIKYLTKRGAKKVYGLDISQNQINEASKYNREEIDKGIVELFRSPMEKKLNIKPVDVVFSVYGVGWTQDPELTFSNIYSYLKSGGLFIWSWDHSFFTDIKYKNGKFIVVYPYHEEKSITIRDWRKPKCNAHITYRKSATWFKLLKKAGFQIENYIEPEPLSLEGGYNDPAEYRSIQKARLVPSSFIFVCKKP